MSYSAFLFTWLFIPCLQCLSGIRLNQVCGGIEVPAHSVTYLCAELARNSCWKKPLDCVSPWADIEAELASSLILVEFDGRCLIQSTDVTLMGLEIWKFGVHHSM